MSGRYNIGNIGYHTLGLSSIPQAGVGNGRKPQQHIHTAIREKHVSRIVHAYWPPLE